MNAYKIFNLVIAFVFAFSLLGMPAPVLATSPASVQSASFTTCADVTEIPRVECEALIALYNSTNGAGWVNNTDWLATDTPCSWYGIECGGGHVTKLRMGANQLSGSIPSELGNLSQLTSLRLPDNQLTGSIPAELGNLAQLNSLEFSNNQLSGSIPGQLGNLTQLIGLYLNNNLLSGSIPPQLGNLIQLEKLRLENNQLSGNIPADLGNLAQLTTLNLDNNQLSGDIPEELGNLAKLTDLWIEQNQLSGSIPSQLGNLTQLTDLGLGRNQLSGSIPAELGNLTQLTWLGLCGNQLSGSIPAELGNLTQLTWLGLCDIQLSGSIPTDLGNLTQLTWLFLHNTQLSGEFPASITNLVNLTTLTFDCNLTSSDPLVIEFLNEKSPGWQANQCVRNTIGVNVNGYHPNWVDGLDWTIGELVNVVIDDPVTPGNPDAHINDIEVLACEFNPTTGCFRANFNGLYHIKVGDLVTVNQGAIAKTHEVLTVEITNVDPETDVVSGTTDPFVQIRVMAWPSFGPGLATNREVTADGFGIWSTDFTDDDPETDDYDLVSGTYVRGDRFDEDSDYTTFMEWIPYPSIQASVQYDWVRAMDWPSGAEVHLTINGQDFGSAIVEQENPTSANFDLGEYELQTGDLVTVTDGVQEKSLTVSLFEVTGVNTDTDVVSGIGIPGAQLYVSVHQNGNNIWRGTKADSASGAWEVDFTGVVDIQVGSEGDAQERDSDGDSTWYEWNVPEPPNFHVRPGQNEIHAFRWTEGNQVHVTVDDPSTSNPIDYEETQEAVMTEWFDDMTFIIFRVQGMTLQPGQIVTLTDGVTTKTHVIQELSMAGVNPTTDTVEGYAASNAFVHVWENCDQDVCAFRYVEADNNGKWVADFTVPGNNNSPEEQKILNIQPGSSGNANIRDDDGDFTTLNWSVPIDTDVDGIPDDVDNAPFIFNPDQRDVDSDGIADVLDPCPSDATNTCNISGSTSSVIGSQGGMLAPSNGMVEMNVPASALDEFTSLSITDAGGNYEIASDQGTMTVIHSYSIQPHGTQFSQPVAITFQWEDADNNGVIDGTTLLETQIMMIKDGLVISPSCAINPDCDMVANKLTVHISDLSLFALAVPLNQPPVADAGGPYFGNEGTTINLSASKSTDPDNSIVLYKWDLDNDGQFDDATGKKPKFKAVDNGVFTVSVRVTDAGGLSSVDSATITIKNLPPAVTSLTVNSLVRVGVKLNVSAAFKDAGVNDTFTAIWKWGDGTSSTGSVSGHKVIGSHIYTKPGIYLVSITVKDNDGGEGQMYKLIIVLPKR